MRGNTNTRKDHVAYWDTYDAHGIGVGGYTDSVLLESLATGAVLEVGCGRGGKIGFLSTPTKRYGIDYSKRAIQEAQQTFPNVTFFVADACVLPFSDESFDTVFSLEVIEHIKNYDDMLWECHRVLKPGGHLFIQTPNYPIKRLYDLVHFFRGARRNLGDDYSHVSRFSARALRSAVGMKFNIKIVETRNILGENMIPWLARLRKSHSVLGLLLGQKTIIVGEKPFSI